MKYLAMIVGEKGVDSKNIKGLTGSSFDALQSVSDSEMFLAPRIGAVEFGNMADLPKVEKSLRALAGPGPWRVITIELKD